MNDSTKPVEQMTFLEMVKKLRECQQEYFRTRTQTALKHAKWWEVQVDNWLAMMEKVDAMEQKLDKQGDLWPK